MQDYSVLFPKEYRDRQFTDTDKIKIIERFLGSGCAPLTILMCIMVFLSCCRQGTPPQAA
jgi:hypothetical protein